jgi:hypothetical protein
MEYGLVLFLDSCTRAHVSLETKEFNWYYNRYRKHSVLSSND